MSVGHDFVVDCALADLKNSLERFCYDNDVPPEVIGTLASRVSDCQIQSILDVPHGCAEEVADRVAANLLRKDGHDIKW